MSYNLILQIYLKENGKGTTRQAYNSRRHPNQLIISAKTREGSEIIERRIRLTKNQEFDHARNRNRSSQIEARH